MYVSRVESSTLVLSVRFRCDRRPPSRLKRPVMSLFGTRMSDKTKAEESIFAVRRFIRQLPLTATGGTQYIFLLSSREFINSHVLSEQHLSSQSVLRYYGPSKICLKFPIKFTSLSDVYHLVRRTCIMSTVPYIFHMTKS